ncbi:hypothetical protein OSI78_20135, partial [Mycobacterium ulcerans]
LARRAAGPVGPAAGLSAAAVAPGVASYTAVLLSQTAVPAWHEAHPYLPFVFTGSAAASGGGLGMLLAPVAEAAPARRMSVAGAALEVAASRLLERRLGLVGEAYYDRAGAPDPQVGRIPDRRRGAGHARRGPQPPWRRAVRPGPAHRQCAAAVRGV